MKTATILLIGSIALSSQAKTTSTTSAKEAPRARAVELFKSNCEMCHGEEGKGSEIMAGLNFVDRGTSWKHGNRQAEVIKTITDGVPDTPMQSFKDKFTTEEIAALASLVRSYDKTIKKVPFDSRP